MNYDSAQQADQAWQARNLDHALALMQQAFTVARTAENACRLACLLHFMGRQQDAKNLLLSVILQAPHFLPAQTQLARMVRMDTNLQSPEGMRERIERGAILQQMNASLEADPFFKPSKFWDWIAAKHTRMLDHSGVGNFKRTVAHNYQNWLIASESDKQWQRLRTIWQAQPTLQPLLNTIELIDDSGFIWEEEQPSYALSNPAALSVYKLAVGILWEFAVAHDALGFLSGFEESTIGNPIRIRREGTLISQDAAHSSREMNTLFQAAGLRREDRLTIAEVGAGQGRLAEMLGRNTNFRYLIFDIPPTLYVSQWYLQKLFPNERVFTFRNFSSWEDVQAEVENCRFSFFTPNQIKFLPARSIDIFINVCSLMEMQKQHIDYFLRRIGEITRGYFFSKQWHRWKNEVDQIELSKSDFRLGADFEVIYDQDDDVYPDLFVQLWRRRSMMGRA